MGKVEPNHYQKDIINWVLNGDGNAIVNALAGTGKTSTLEMVAQACNKKMLFLAFNKHIAEELTNKPTLSPKAKKKDEGGTGELKIMTVNSLGDMIMRDTLGTRVKSGELTYPKGGFLKPNKLLGILGKILRDNCNTRGIKYDDDMIWTMQRDLKTACDKVRAKYMSTDEDSIQKIIIEDKLCQFNVGLDKDDPTQIVFPVLPWAQICEDALIRSMDLYQERGEYDFVEQLFLPIKLKMGIPSWLGWYTGFIMIDEAQDISKLQLALIKKVSNYRLPMGKAAPTRFLFVGDKNQAIYAFAGADCHSITNIKKQVYAQEFPLNICYRCAKKIIKVAQQDVPEIEAAPNAIEGEVYTIRNEEIGKLIQPRRYGNSKKE